MRADIHDGPEHNTLQTEAGYIDARPTLPIDEILLHRAAGPYIGVTTGSLAYPWPDRFTPESGRRSTDLPCRLWANSGTGRKRPRRQFHDLMESAKRPDTRRTSIDLDQQNRVALCLATFDLITSLVRVRSLLCHKLGRLAPPS